MRPCVQTRLPGGDEEVRTPDPLRARQVLSQLSYTPIHGMASVFCSEVSAELALNRALKIKQYSQNSLNPCTSHRPP